MTTEPLEVKSPSLTVSYPGWFRSAYRAIIIAPLFNALAFLTHILPAHSFGWAIVVLTFFIRAALYYPSWKGMVAQRKLQKLQPKLAELKVQYKDNPQGLAMQTMQLYKDAKVSPVSGCLPILLQIPFLLGIYSIVEQGISPHLSYMLYDFNPATLLGIDSHFLGLNLSLPDPWYILPVLVAVSQWGAIRLGMFHQKKKQDIKLKKDDTAAQMEQATAMMQWMMPALIGFTTMSTPAAVGVYWFVSTMLGVAQQWLVNRSLEPKKNVILPKK
jgi:YidC/Oxa1 family membrane protein insertase